MIEHIVAVSPSVLGVPPNKVTNLPAGILNPANIFICPRHLIENNPDFVQLIPYVAVWSTVDQTFIAYRRKGSEERLDNKISIGFGGHMNFNHVATVTTQSNGSLGDIKLAIKQCALTELREELRLNGSPFNPLNFKMINFGVFSTKTDVDRCHYGILCVCRTDKPISQFALGDMGKAIFPYSPIKHQDYLESWSLLGIETFKEWV
jgi:predicted NUDIX family phosphoesterase